MKANHKSNRQWLFNPDELINKLAHQLQSDINHASKNCVGRREFQEFASLQTKNYTKKYRSTSANSASAAAALAKFRNVLEHIRESQRFLRCPSEGYLRRNPEADRLLIAMIRARSLVHQILGEFDTEEWFECTKHGIGASIGVGFRDTSLEAKCLLPASITDECIPVALTYLKWDVTFCDALQRHNPQVSWPNGAFKVVHGSRITTVPKTNEIDRVIAIEPTWNMFLQQGLMAVLARRLKAFGVDIETQQFHHRKMAYYTSITKGFGTIDFSSASDCVSYNLLKELLPPVWFEVLCKVRSSVTSLEGELTELPCFATMGNATTFPLETLVFYALGVAAVDAIDNTSLSSFVEYESLCSGVSVFGDDCIVPDRAVQLFMILCEYCGFIVNSEKSFYGGKEQFRESCGADYWSGRNIRSVYIQSPSSTRNNALRAWLYTLWNIHLKKTMSAFGELTYVYQSSVLAELARWIIRYNKEVFIVPDDYPDDSGIKLLGDGDRLLRLFSDGRVSGFRVSRHGVLQFKCLSYRVFGLDDETPELRSDPIHLWHGLKFPRPRVRQAFPYIHNGVTFYTYVELVDGREPNPYKSKKDGRYVVTCAQDSRALAAWAVSSQQLQDIVQRRGKLMHTAQ